MIEINSNDEKSVKNERLRCKINSIDDDNGAGYDDDLVLVLITNSMYSANFDADRVFY